MVFFSSGRGGGVDCHPEKLGSTSEKFLDEPGDAEYSFELNLNKKLFQEFYNAKVPVRGMGWTLFFMSRARTTIQSLAQFHFRELENVVDVRKVDLNLSVSTAICEGSYKKERVEQFFDFYFFGYIYVKTP